MAATDVERAWLACAVDGEGHITIYTNTRRRSVMIGINNTSTAFLERAADIIEHMTDWRPVVRRGKTSPIGKKPIFGVYVTGTRAIPVLREIRPFLIIKGGRADMALALKLRTHDQQLRDLHALATWTRRARDDKGRLV